MVRNPASDLELYWLIRGILRLKRTDVGLSFLLALASQFVLGWILAQSSAGEPAGDAVWKFLGPAFKAGHYVGRLIFPDYAVRGTTGFYVVPLFGLVAQILFLWWLWYVPIRVVRWMRAGQDDRQRQNF